MRVFIADDSARLRSQLIGLLSDLGEVEIVGQAADAQSTVTALRVLKPDVLTLDIRMPGGSGIEVLKAIRQDEHVPVTIMLTNHSATPYRNESLQAGADYFFDKATEFHHVRSTIQNLLGKTTASDEAGQLLYLGSDLR